MRGFYLSNRKFSRGAFKCCTISNRRGKHRDCHRSAGVGKEAAFDFAQRGARVILACRNMEKAEIVKDWIVSSTGNKNVICHHLELSDLDSVRKFAKETIQREKRIDILVNNAGTFQVQDNCLSKDMSLLLRPIIMVIFF
ncbi:Retinol dehydrogenase 11 [Armadillidium vulgare]|nr:Retinol dehydrogenase 11 [Armadillidium vulgare]